MSRKTTVTHPDGTVSTRTSQTRTYTHAVAIGPAPAEAYAANLIRSAERAEAAAQTIRAAADAGKVTIRSRGFRSTGSATALDYVAKLVGSDVYTWCNAGGMTDTYPQPYPAPSVLVPVGAYLVDTARENAEQRDADAHKARARALAIRAAGVPVGQWEIGRWSSREDLARKCAAGSDFAHCREAGHPVVAVEVDPC